MTRLKQVSEEEKATYRLTLCYDGKPFFGWQRQVGRPTVQEEVEKALRHLFKQLIGVNGSGRTDTGVHALGQVVSFEAPLCYGAGTLKRALNAHLPSTIRVNHVQRTHAGFHARFDATSKTYRYQLYQASVHDPFYLATSWYHPRPLDVSLMRRARQVLLGRHDFASFTSNPGYARPSTVRHLMRLSVTQEGALMVLTFTADGFLYRMVRNLVGALVQVGKKRLSVEELQALLKIGSRKTGLPTAPAQGLFLVRVHYGKTKKARKNRED